MARRCCMSAQSNTQPNNIAQAGDLHRLQVLCACARTRHKPNHGPRPSPAIRDPATRAQRAPYFTPGETPSETPFESAPHHALYEAQQLHQGTWYTWCIAGHCVSPQPSRLSSAMQSTPLLYTYRRCPYAIRARMALLQAGVAFEAHEIALRDKPPAMLAVSPEGTVPVLVLPNGTVLEQSLDIMRWAFAQRADDQQRWASAQSPANVALQQACDGPFKHHLDRYKYPQRFADAKDPQHHRQEAVMGATPNLW